MVNRTVARLAMIGLLIAGAIAIHFSAWPDILSAMNTGARVVVAPTPETVGLPVLAALLWGGALVVALRSRRPRRKIA